MSFPLLPAELAFAGDGTPYSPGYGDVYHSSQGGLEQARHVFLGGNGLLGENGVPSPANASSAGSSGKLIRGASAGTG